MARLPAPAGDRRSQAKHRAILRAAIEVFLRDGYARAGVDAIAAAAGVGKQTIYGHFDNKKRLFLAAVDEAESAASPESLAELVADTGDPGKDLLVTGEHLLRALLAPDVLALYRLTIAELPHHPELQRSRCLDGPQAPFDELAAYFSACDQRGQFSVPDPALAARQFVMLLNAEGQARSLRGMRTLATDQLRDIAGTTTDLIIRAHRT